jgi:hypothetical protein
MKLLKILRIVAIVLLLVILIVSIAGKIYGGRLIKWGVEKAGSSALKVPVGLGGANLSILGGSLSLKNLSIGNPPEYQHKQFLELKNASVKIKPASLLSGTIRIPEIKLNGINVVLEQKDIRNNNLQDILKNISAGEGKIADKTKQAEGKKLRIDYLELTDISVQVKLLPLPGKVDTIPLKLPPIKMKDIGNDGKTDTAALVSKIIVAISAGIAESGAGLLPDDLTKSLNSTLKGLGEIGGQLLEGRKTIGEGLKKTGEGVGGKVKDIGGALQGLVKPKEEKKQ